MLQIFVTLLFVKLTSIHSRAVHKALYLLFPHQLLFPNTISFQLSQTLQIMVNLTLASILELTYRFYYPFITFALTPFTD